MEGRTMFNVHFLALVTPDHPESFASLRVQLERHNILVEPGEVKRQRHANGTLYDGLLCHVDFPDAQIEARLRAIGAELAPNVSDIDWHNGDKNVHRIAFRQ